MTLGHIRSSWTHWVLSWTIHLARLQTISNTMVYVSMKSLQSVRSKLVWTLNQIDRPWKLGNHHLWRYNTIKLYFSRQIVNCRLKTTCSRWRWNITKFHKPLSSYTLLSRNKILNIMDVLIITVIQRWDPNVKFKKSSGRWFYDVVPLFFWPCLIVLVFS